MMLEESMDNRIKILNAFRPSTEAVSPKIFAGREAEVLALTDAMITEGLCPLIYGDRGLGKSSLAYQTARIALGDNSLLTLLGKPERAIPASEILCPIWLSCSDDIKTKNDLIEAIINNGKGFTKLPPESGNNIKEIFDNGDIDLGNYRYEAQKEVEASGRSFSNLSSEEKFSIVSNKIKNKLKCKLLFIIDELDRAHNTNGLGSFIKNNSSTSTKFLLVGVSNSISSLLKDHSSVERQLLPVPVKEMISKELIEIVNKTVKNLDVNGIKIEVDKMAMINLINAADGFPWFVHVLGQSSLVDMWDSGKVTILDIHISNAIQNLATNRFAQSFNDIYTKAIKDSVQREKVLRLMSKWRNADVPLADIYRMAKKIGVTNPSQCKKDLSQATCGKVIYTPTGTGETVIRFHNAMFKKYVNLRSSIYQDLNQEIMNVWKNSGY